MSKTIEFCIPDIEQLQITYLEHLETIKELLPNINLNSRTEVKEYLKDELWLALPDLKIATLKTARDMYPHDHEGFNILTGLIEYYTITYTFRNYINCILRHHQQGTVTLREENGVLLMPNKQPLSTHPDILSCIVPD